MFGPVTRHFLLKAPFCVNFHRFDFRLGHCLMSTRRISRRLLYFWPPRPEVGTAGERRGAVPLVSERQNGGELGQQIGQRPPQVGIVLLKLF